MFVVRLPILDHLECQFFFIYLPFICNCWPEEVVCEPNVV
jgi:hypothetical protein